MAITAFRNVSPISSFPSSLFLILSLSLIILLNAVHCEISENHRPLTYKVAVFEYAVINAPGQVDNREQALQAMRKNIDVYNETVTEAKSKGVKLLVFPEYGIYGVSVSRKRMSLFAETILDPQNGFRNPCEDPEFKGQSTEVQRTMSCIARDNEMFVVINMAGRELCGHQSGCPPDGQYLFNTNVVFSPKGELVARYYKRHLYEEDWFDPAKSAEAVIFDTPFGKFGTFICFDVTFKNPAVELVEKYNVRNIVTPVAWVKTPPFLRSIQMHSAFARGVKVNLLAANLHLQMSTSYGSGIYTPDGVAAYYYEPNAPNGKLVVADIHQIESSVVMDPKNPKEIQTQENIPVANQYNLTAHFKFQYLKEQSGSVKVCHRSFCCKASYAVKSPFQEKYALGVYNGYIVSSQNKLYAQVCTLLKCPPSKCGSEIHNVQTTFTNISLEGVNGSSKYLYPSVLSMDGQQYVLVPNAWNYSKENGINIQPGNNINLHSANLLGRIYSKDIIVGENNSGNKFTISACIQFILYSIIAYVF